MKKLFSHSSVIFPVEDPWRSATYYQEVLGFKIAFTWEDPPSYVVVNRDEAVSIHFSKREDDYKPSGRHVALAVFVHDVDALYKEFEASGATISNPIGNRPWGMRDFDTIDPDGFIISFGQEL